MNDFTADNMPISNPNKIGCPENGLMDTKSEWKYIRDAVHGEIELHPLCVSIIDTPEFQRLRNISQCGVTHLVYPSACHSRFEHSLGVYQLAHVMLNKLEGKGQKISEEDKLCVRIAALCHDIGHGPFSHTWERFLHLSGKKDFKHEENSVKLLEYLIEKNNLSESFKEFKIDGEKKKFIHNLIRGKKAPESKEKEFLFEIVANCDTGVDVDRWDYMLRDALHFGYKIQLDHERILSSAIVFEMDSTSHIVFRDKVARNILEMYETREKLHRICYQHKVCKVIEIMLLEALCLFDEHYRVEVGSGKQKLKLSECHEKEEAFIKLSDYLYYLLLHSSDENLAAGRYVLERICRRKLFPIIKSIILKDVRNESDFNEFEGKIREEIKKKMPDFDASKVYIAFIKIATNPEELKKVLCYDKNKQLINFPFEIQKSDNEALMIWTGSEDIPSEIKEELEQIFLA